MLQGLLAYLDRLTVARGGMRGACADGAGQRVAAGGEQTAGGTEKSVGQSWSLAQLDFLRGFKPVASAPLAVFYGAREKPGTGAKKKMIGRENLLAAGYVRFRMFDQIPKDWEMELGAIGD